MCESKLTRIKVPLNILIKSSLKDEKIYKNNSREILESLQLRPIQLDTSCHVIAIVANQIAQVCEPTKSHLDQF